LNTGIDGWGCSQTIRAAAAVLLAGALAAAAPAAEKPLALEGDFTQGGLVIGTAAPGARVVLDGRPLRVGDSGRFLLGFGRDARPAAELVVTYPDGTRRARSLTISQRAYEVQRIDGLPPKMVTPEPAVLERIRREQALVAAARERDTAAAFFESGFIWPCLGPISGVYGSQRILNGEPRQPHFGIDIAAPAGTPVRAPADGVVVLVHPDMYFSGGTVIIDHGHGLSSAFLHLSRVTAGQGQRLRQGEVFAEVGATGRVTGAHLDWRMNLFSERLDPQLLVPPMPAARAGGE